MTRLGFAFSMVALVVAASWAYHVNYRTKQALSRIDVLRAQIAAEREATEVLRIEWAYLNAPDRLAQLVALNNDRLGLVPMGPQHFDDLAVVPFRPSAPALPQPVPQAEIVIASEGESAEPQAVAFTDAPMPLPRPAAWRGQ